MRGPRLLIFSLVLHYVTSSAVSLVYGGIIRMEASMDDEISHCKKKDDWSTLTWG